MAFAPTLAEAATSSSAAAHHLTPAVSPSAVSASVAKAAGLKNYASPFSKSVYRRAAAAAPGTTPPNPKLAVAVTAQDSNALGVALTVNVEGLNTGSATLTITWDGGGVADTVTVDPGTTSMQFQHEYPQTGSYSIGVTVTDGSGDQASNNLGFVQTAGAEFTAYGPFRLLDTRKGLGAPTGAVAPHGTLKLKVVGAGVAGDTIPAGIRAVALNVTVTGPTANGDLAAYGDQDQSGDAESAPDTSNLNFRAGQTVANLVIAPVGANGVVDLANESAGSTQMVADVAGYFSATDSIESYVPMTPTRILDTRKGIGTGGTVAKVPGGGNVILKIADNGVVPISASSAALNITAIGGSSSGFITAYSCRGPVPNTSTLNYAAGETVANAAILASCPVSTGFYDITLHNSGAGPVDLIVDETGYFEAGSGVAPGAGVYIPLDTPIRYLDTRQFGSTGIPAGTPLGLPFAPESYDTAAVVNMTVTDTTGSGYLSLYPYNPDEPSALPTTSTLNYTKGETVPNLAIAAPGSVYDPDFGAYDLGLYLGGAGSAQLVMDMFGVFESK